MARLYRSLLIILILLFSFTAFAAEYIRAIEVQGNTVTNSDSVVALMKSRQGGEYSREIVQEDVKALFASGKFSDVRIDRESMSGGGIKLVVHVAEKPIIAKISFTGNKKIKAKALQEKVTVEKYEQLNQTELLASIDKIKEAYRKKDFNLVEVNYELKTMESGETELIFKITENQKTYINKVNFIGNHVFSDKELRKVIKSKKKGGIFSFLGNSGKLRDELLEADVVFLARHYLNHGYIRVNVGAPNVEITKDKKYVYITYTIDEGKQYRVKNVTVAGDILTTPEEILTKTTTKTGEIYNQDKVEADIDAITIMYGNVGYAFAMVRPVPEINDSDDTVNLVYYVEKGKRIRIEKINISGNKVTRDKVIRRELRVNENDIYNEENVRLSKTKLMQLGYFESVDFSTPRGSRDDTLILNINVKEKPTGTFNIGAGFSTVDKFIFSGSIAKENFFGLGWSGQIAAELSSRRQMFIIEMTDPYFLDTNWMLGLSGYRTRYRYEDFDRESLGGGVTLGRRLFDYSAVSLGYKYEDVKVTDFQTVVPQIFKDTASGRTSQISLEMSRDDRDNRIITRKGTLNLFSAEVSGSKLGGTNDFARFSYNSRAYVPIKWGFVAKANARIGYIKSLSGKPVPLFERYFTGGVNSLRGFYPLSIGPAMQVPTGPAGGTTNFVYGGNKELLFNVEMEMPIYEPGGFKGVVFFDAGNAYAENQSYSFNNIRMDYGFGLRWQSPMGPLRFEWGFPINRKPGEDKIVFNFTIGSFF